MYLTCLNFYNKNISRYYLCSHLYMFTSCTSLRGEEPKRWPQERLIPRWKRRNETPTSSNGVPVCASRVASALTELLTTLWWLLSPCPMGNTTRHGHRHSISELSAGPHHLLTPNGMTYAPVLSNMDDQHVTPECWIKICLSKKSNESYPQMPNAPELNQLSRLD